MRVPPFSAATGFTNAGKYTAVIACTFANGSRRHLKLLTEDPNVALRHHPVVMLIDRLNQLLKLCRSLRSPLLFSLNDMQIPLRQCTATYGQRTPNYHAK